MEARRLVSSLVLSRVSSFDDSWTFDGRERRKIQSIFVAVAEFLVEATLQVSHAA